MKEITPKRYYPILDLVRYFRSLESMLARNVVNKQYWEVAYMLEKKAVAKRRLFC